MAGTPTRAEIETQVNNDLDALDVVRLASADYLTEAAAAVEDMEGDFLPYASPALLREVRRRIAEINSPGMAQQVWYPALREFGKLINSRSVNPADYRRLAIDLYENMHANSRSVNGRNITRGTPSAGGGNTGDGILARLNQDWNQYPLESGIPEVMTATCREDGGSGTRYGAEVFDLEGGDAAADFAEQLGSGLGVKIPVLHGGSNGAGRSLLKNSSFDVAHAADDTSTSKISGWTISSGATSLEESSTIAVEAPGVTTANSRSLEFEGNAKIIQTLESAIAGGLTPFYATPQPLFAAVLLNRQSSCDGTFGLKIGSQQTTVDVSTLSNGAWTWHLWKVDHNCWPQNFNEDDLDVELELSSNTTGTVLVDSLVCNYWLPFNGTFYALRGGATHFLYDDVFTITDSGGAATAAEVQFYYAHALRPLLGWRAYLPSENTGNEIWSDF